MIFIALFTSGNSRKLVSIRETKPRKSHFSHFTFYSSPPLSLPISLPHLVSSSVPLLLASCSFFCKSTTHWESLRKEKKSLLSWTIGYYEATTSWIQVDTGWEILGFLMRWKDILLEFMFSDGIYTAYYDKITKI